VPRELTPQEALIQRFNDAVKHLLPLVQELRQLEDLSGVDADHLHLASISLSNLWQQVTHPFMKPIIEEE
jgi:hypothetical protein